ncbi:ATP-binding protein [uncultured Methanocorpusculum sp.]|nr:ATP-binding protein [uncultured Methanocorpusculum sp.]
MLIQFKFKNFKSFKDETILDLSATKVTEHPHHVVTIGKEKILKTAAIYGANASGKTNVYDAFGYMSYYVTKSFNFGGAKDTGKTKVYKKPLPFLLSTASKDMPSLFEVYFTLNDEEGKIYNYGFTVDNMGVSEEWLNYKAETGRKYYPILYRERGSEIAFPKIPKEYRDNLKVSLQDEALIVSLGAKLKVPILETIHDWFFKLHFLDFGSPDLNFILSLQMPPGFEKEPTFRKEVAAYLSTFDHGIVDFNVEEIPSSETNSSPKYRIDAVHQVNGSGETVNIPLAQESAGTQKMFVLYYPLKNVLKSGGVFFIDELNARLHPLLVQDFIITFLDKETNPNNAQLIFTTHDSWLLSSDLLRRDEIWFTEKDGNGASCLYSLVDFKGENVAKIRKDENYAKNYLLGKYGAIPELKKINVVSEKHAEYK